LIDGGYADPVAASEKRDTCLPALPVIIALKRFYAAAIDAEGTIWTIIDIGASTVGSNALLGLTNLCRVSTVRIPHAEVFPALTSAADTAFILGALIIADTLGIDTEAVGANRNIIAVIIRSAFRFKGIDGYCDHIDIGTVAEVIGENIVYTRFCVVDGHPGE